MEVDLAGEIQSYSHDAISKEQAISLLHDFSGQDGADIFENMQRDYDFLALINSMGFSYEDFQKVAALAKAMRGEGMPSSLTGAQKFEYVRSALYAAMDVFEGDKLLPKGHENFDFDRLFYLLGMRRNFLYQLGFSIEEIREAKKSASGTALAQYEALESLYEYGGAGLESNIDTKQLVVLGRLIKGIYLAAREIDSPLLDYAVAGLINATAGNQYYEETDMQGVYHLARNVFNDFNPMRLIREIGELYKVLEMNAASYGKMLGVVYEYFHVGREGSIMGSSQTFFDDTIYDAIERIYLDNVDLVAGKDLKVLFEFVADIAASISDDLIEKSKTNALSKDDFVALYDKCFAKLSAQQKGSLKNLAELLGLDYDALIDGLKNLPENGRVDEALLSLISPMIEKYQSDAFIGVSVNSNYGTPYFAQNEKVNPQFFASTIRVYGDASRLVSFQFDEDADTSVTGFHRIKATATLSVMGKEVKRVGYVHYFVLPDVLLSPLPFRKTEAVCLEKADSFVIEHTTRSFSVNARRYAYDASTHSFRNVASSFNYTYSQLNWALGEHTLTLRNKAGESYDFRYFVYDSSNVTFEVFDAGREYTFVHEGVIYIHPMFAKEGKDEWLYLHGGSYVQTGDNRYYVGSGFSEEVSLPKDLAPGKEAEVTLLNGHKVRIVYLSDSDITNSYRSIDVYFRDARDIDGYYLLPRGFNVEQALEANVYRNDEIKIGTRTYHFGYHVDERPSLEGFDTATVSKNVKRGYVRSGDASQEIRYVVIDDNSFENVIYCGDVVQGGVPEVREMLQRIEVNDNGETVSLADHHYMPGSDFDLSKLDTKTKGEHKVTIEGVTFEYNVIGIDEISVVAMGMNYSAMDGTGGQPIYFGFENDFEFTYKGRYLGSSHVEPESGELDKKPGAHTYKAECEINGVKIPVTCHYVIYDGVKLRAMDNGVLLVKQNDNVYVDVEMVFFLGEEETVVARQQMPIGVDTSVAGYHEVDLSKNQQMPLEGKVRYFVYDESNIRRSVHVDTPRFFARYDKSAEFYITIEQTVDCGEYGILSYQTTEWRQVSLYDESELTPGMHEVELFVNGQTIIAQYEVLTIDSPEVSIDPTNYEVELASNGTVAIGESLQLQQLRIRVSYSPREGETRYDSYSISPEQCQIVGVDTSKATSTRQKGYVLYAGMAFAFEYFVYDPAKIDESQVSTEFYSDNRNVFVEGELRAGRDFYYSGYLRRRANVDGMTITLFEGYVHGDYRLSANDVSKGVHSIKTQEGFELPYEIVGLDDSRVEARDIRAEGVKEAYALGEEGRFVLRIEAELSYQRYDYTDRTNVYIEISSYDDLRVTGFDTSTVSGTNKRTATLSFGSMSYSFEYQVYDPTHLSDTRENEVSCARRNVYCLEEANEDLLYVEVDIKTYGYADGVRILLESRTTYLVFDIGGLSAGKQKLSLASFGYEGTLDIELIGINDARVSLDGIYINYGDYYYAVNEEPYFYAYNVKILVDGEYVECNNRVKLSASYFDHDVVTAEATHGFRESKVYHNGDSFGVRYYVYSMEQLVQRDDFTHKLILEGDSFDYSFRVSSHIETEEGLYEIYTSEYRLDDEQLISRIESQEGLPAGTYSARFYDYRSGNYITRKFTLTYLKESDCVQTGEAYVYASTPIYQGTQASLNVYDLTIKYFYQGFYVTERYHYAEDFVVDLDTSEAGSRKMEVTYEGMPIKVYYYVEELPPLEGVRVVYLDVVSGEYNVLDEGASIQTDDILYCSFLFDSGVDDGICAEIGDSIYEANNGSFAIALEDGTYAVTIHHLVYGYSLSFNVTFGAVESKLDYVMTQKSSGEGYFRENNGTYTSTNILSGGFAELTFNFLKAGTFTFSYDVSSENGCDGLRIDHNGESVGWYSGDKKGTFTWNVAAGDTISLIYSKDGSVDEGRDNVIISGITFTQGEVPASKTVIYYSNSLKWGDIYCVYLTKDGESHRVQLTTPYEINDYGENIYRLEFDLTEVVSVKFDNGGTASTEWVNFSDYGGVIGCYAISDSPNADGSYRLGYYVREGE